MPEGDTIHYAAGLIRPVLEGRVPDAIETPHPRFGADRWPKRLGPDILAPELDTGEFLRRLRHDDPTRPIGDDNRATFWCPGCQT